MGRLAERIDEVLSLDVAAPAVNFGAKWTDWGALGVARQAVDDALAEEGLALDSRVGLIMRNDVAMIPAIYGVIANRCLVTLNPMVNAAKLAADAATAGLPAVIGMARDLDAAALTRSLADTGCLVLEMTGEASQPVIVRQRRSERNRAEARSIASEIALEMLTSGTTGTPKRIPMRRNAFETAVFGAAHFEKGRSADDAAKLRQGIQLLMAPLAHISGLLALMNAVVGGRAIALLERFRVEDFRDAVSRHQIKVASIPPAALKMIHEADIPKEDLQSLQAFRVGTAPLDPDLADAIYRRYGIPILQNYGATEFGGVAGWTIEDFRVHRIARRGSVGRLNPGIEGRVVDAESGRVLAHGQTGVLELKAAQIGDGQGWTRTTDLARLDEENFLWIIGRADNAIIRGGFKVHPDEVVRALESHPSIVEASVVGLDDSRLGQVPGAVYIAARGGNAPTQAEIVDHLRSKLTGYQIPVVFMEVEELPRTASLKADQQAVKAMLQPHHQRTVQGA